MLTASDILDIIRTPILNNGHRLTLIVLRLHPEGLTIRELLAAMAMNEGERATLQRYLAVLIERGYACRYRRGSYNSDPAYVYCLTEFLPARIMAGEVKLADIVAEAR